MRQLSQKEIHAFLTDILVAVDEYCKKENLRYSMAYGTLLGAVRHKGFIPWDDDIDLLMPRPDFDRFVAGFGKEPGARYTCLYNTDNESGRFVHFYAKIQDTHTLSKEKRAGANRFGVNLDIFPVDGKPDIPDAEQLKRERLLAHYSHRLNICGSRFNIFNFRQPLMSKIDAHLHGSAYWQQKIDAETRRYPFEGSRIAGSSPAVYNGLRAHFPREWFEEYTELPFEGHMFKAVTHWDEFLTKQFGDYMKLPPEKDRVTHSLTVYEL